MIQKKYIRIILGALCVFLLLSLLSSAYCGKKEGFEGAEQDMTPEAFERVLNTIVATAPQLNLPNETPADAAAFNKLLKKKVVHFFGTLPVPYNSSAPQTNNAVSSANNNAVSASNAEVVVSSYAVGNAGPADDNEAPTTFPLN